MSDWTSFGNGPTDAISPNDVLDLLASLSDKSLVILDEATGRYRMLETIRDYGRATLSAREETTGPRDRHRDYFVSWIDAIHGKLAGPQQADWLDRVEDDHDNLRSALIWCMQGAPPTVAQESSNANISPAAYSSLHLSARLCPFWSLRGHITESRERIGAVLSHFEALTNTRLYANALQGAARLAADQSDPGAGLPMALQVLHFFKGTGEQAAIATALNDVCLNYMLLRRFPEAREAGEECLALFQTLGLIREQAFSFGSLGLLAIWEGDWQTAKVRLAECVALFRQVGDTFGVANNLCNLAFAAKSSSDPELAMQCLQEGLPLSAELRAVPVVADAVEMLASFAAETGQPERAALLYGAVEHMRIETGTPLFFQDNARHDREVIELREVLGPEDFKATWAKGRAMDLDETIAVALDPP